MIPLMLVNKTSPNDKFPLQMPSQCTFMSSAYFLHMPGMFEPDRCFVQKIGLVILRVLLC